MPTQKYIKYEWENGMTANICSNFIDFNLEHVFGKDKPEVVELVAKQMLQAVEIQKKMALEQAPKY